MNRSGSRAGGQQVRLGCAEVEQGTSRRSLADRAASAGPARAVPLATEGEVVAAQGSKDQPGAAAIQPSKGAGAAASYTPAASSQVGDARGL